MVTTYIFGYWAVLTDQPSVVIATCALGAAAFVVCLFTQLPLLLRKYLSPRLTIAVNPAKFFPQAGHRPQRAEIPIFIINKSAHNRVILGIEFHIPLSNGKELQSGYVRTTDETFKRELGPQESTRGRLSCSFNPPQDSGAPLFEKAYLHIFDQVSDRSVKIQIPGKFPPE